MMATVDAVDVDAAESETRAVLAGTALVVWRVEKSGGGRRGPGAVEGRLQRGRFPPHGLVGDEEIALRQPAFTFHPPSCDSGDAQLVFDAYWVDDVGSAESRSLRLTLHLAHMNNHEIG
jgi:hypothetical protein